MRPLTSLAFAGALGPPQPGDCIPDSSFNVVSFTGITGTAESFTAGAVAGPGCAGMPSQQSQTFDLTAQLTGAAMSGYIGTDQVNLSGQFFGGGGMGQGALSGESTVTYTYDDSPAPEPGTLALPGMGAAMIAGAIRRRVTRR